MANFENSKTETLEQQKEKRAQEILGDLDLNLNDLQGKTVLDIGAGQAEIAQVANKKGARVYSLEHDLDSLKKENNFSTKDANYVQAQAEKMPFKGESFDLLISHGGPPLINESKKEIEEIIKEGERVLKPNGEWRLGNGYLSAVAFKDLALPDDLPLEERTKRIRQVSLDFLKKIWVGKVQEVQKGKDIYDMYYILTKEKK